MKKVITIGLSMVLLMMVIIPEVSADICDATAGWGNPNIGGMASVKFFGETDIYGNFYSAVDGTGKGTWTFSVLETVYKPTSQGIITASCIKGKWMKDVNGQEWCTYLCPPIINCDIYDEFNGWATGIGLYTGKLKVGYDLDIGEKTCTLNGDGKVTDSELLSYINAWANGELSDYMLLVYISIWTTGG